MNFKQTPEFQKDLKRLSKKWRSIEADIEYAKPRIESLYTDSDDIEEYRAAFFGGKRGVILHQLGASEVIKMRLDVAALGRNDKVRIIFIAVRSKDTITFIELYAKNDKEQQDQRRIKKYL